ncbi:hypothetical protein BDEG_27425 [Batrachochytrium dendrobatidis JEL423]|uniref:Uncharacterized protein n=1 Tax=Batrachochytrium dendrobatidis (strain JEL423) TaxID=403673 RepID=A0A177WVS3_BATDL|nr:hypothetical protein BDEG_27425 [Batrachochytrium dendrobatidis JEL423]
MVQEYGVHDIANQLHDNPDQTELIGLTLATQNNISGQVTSSKNTDQAAESSRILDNHLLKSKL